MLVLLSLWHIHVQTVYDWTQGLVREQQRVESVMPGSASDDGFIKVPCRSVLWVPSLLALISFLHPFSLCICSVQMQLHAISRCVAVLCVYNNSLLP